MAQPPKDIQAKLRQMADEERLRSQLKSQYDAEMAKRYTRDVVPFAQWMSDRNAPGMAKGGQRVLPPERREQNLAKFLEPSAEKRRMYHGTRSAGTRSVSKPGQQGIEEFKHGLRGMTFVSPDPEFANSYAGTSASGLESGAWTPTVYPVHVQVKKPFDYENPEHVEGILPHLPFGTDYKWSIVHGKTPDEMREALKSGNWDILEDTDVVEAIRDAGHDAMYMKEAGVKNLGVFDPSAIKSATGNRGTYSRRSKEINKAEGGSFVSDIPNEDWLRENVEYAKSKKRNKYGVPYMGKVTGRFKSHVKVPVSVLAKIKGISGEQGNVRQEDLDWLVNHMGKTGKLPLTDRGEEYAPFVTVDYEGTPWVSEGNHRIMAAKKLGWSHLPVEIRYFDGGERVPGEFHPEKLMGVKKADGGTVPKLPANPSMDTMKLALTRNNLGMHSPLEKAAINVPRTKGTAQEFMTEASKQPGFKKEEVEDRGIPMPEGKLTREQFVKHIQSNKSKPIVVDTRYAEDDQTHHDEYTLPGGENYREVLLKQPKWKGDEQIMAREAELRRTEDPVWRNRVQRELDELNASKAKHGEVFPGISAHFGGEPGIVASLRLKDRVGPNGEKILHVEEVQSDWHQQGRKKGYKGSPSQEAVKAGMDQARAMGYSEEQIQEMSPQEIAHFTARGSASVPNAPHKKSWHELALKHALTEAVKGGYHGIAITPGEQQADRYDLSQHIGYLGYEPKEGRLQAHGHDRLMIMNQAGIKPEDLENHIGKEAAQRLLATEPVGGLHLLEGENIKVGGEGMKGFYDKIVPDFLNKLGKKHGAQVAMHGLPIGAPKSNQSITDMLRAEGLSENDWQDMTPDARMEMIDRHDKRAKENVAKLHYFPITPSLRQQIKTEGLPQYQMGGMIHKATGGAIQGTTMNPTMAQMRASLMRRPMDVRTVGVQEAIGLSPKPFLSPDAGTQRGQMPPPGGVATPSGMPIGGIDMSMQPGQQLMPQMQQPQQQMPQGGQPPQPPMAPDQPSNILQMTPQGQAMSAMRPPQMPQTVQKTMGMAKGGTPKALHYAPGPVLRKADIDIYAERMARQMAGLDNPVGTPLKQLARQQSLEVGIRKGGKKQEVPVIDFEKKKGAYSIGVPGDPSRGGLVPTKRSAKRLGIDSPKAGEYLESIGGQKMESPVPLYGGKDYGAYGHPEGWASDLGASAGMFNVVKRLAAENPEREILGHYHKMSPESLNHAVHMLDAVLSHHQPHKASKEKIEQLNTLMRDVATTKGKNDVPYPEFPGFENPADVMLMGAMNSGMRKKIIGLLGTEKYFPGGKQKLDDIIFAVSHPELRNIEAGAGGSSILKFDPTRELREQISAHPTYGHDIPSKLIGKTKYITPAEILAPRSMANAVREIKAMGKKVVPFNQAKMNIIREPIDEQYINQMGEYEQAMRKRLGYKKGGKVAPKANMDTMRLALTKKAK